mmetsp:Transcript_110215/g.310878  ORF Transcript_110215/g.310878 Transcript_110215/m.310878 type:complete len:262 (-) Transcript_110215:408-1193(-)
MAAPSAPKAPRAPRALHRTPMTTVPTGENGLGACSGKHPSDFRFSAWSTPSSALRWVTSSRMSGLRRGSCLGRCTRFWKSSGANPKKSRRRCTRPNSMAPSAWSRSSAFPWLSLSCKKMSEPWKGRWGTQLAKGASVQAPRLGSMASTTGTRGARSGICGRSPMPLRMRTLGALEDASCKRARGFARCGTKALWAAVRMRVRCLVSLSHATLEATIPKRCRGAAATAGLPWLQLGAEALETRGPLCLRPGAEALEAAGSLQ